MVTGSKKGKGPRIIGLFVIGLFIVVGVGGWFFRNHLSINTMATVNGDKIALSAFKNEVETQMAALKRQFGGDIPEELLALIDIKKQALDKLIYQKLMYQEAEKANLSISQQDIVDQIQSLPNFQGDSAFDEKRYLTTLESQGVTKEQFETRMKEVLLINSLTKEYHEKNNFSDPEHFGCTNTAELHLDLDYTFFNPKDYMDFSITKEEVAAYYKEHSSDFPGERKVKAVYLEIDPEEYEAEVTVTENEITDIYNPNRALFWTKRTVNARHILLEIDDPTNQPLVGKRRSDLVAILDKIKDGADFSDMAKQYSEDTSSSDQGGKLPPFDDSTMVKPFTKAAYALTPGQVSEPVLTMYGWHLIQVDGFNEPRQQTMQEVSSEIKKRLITERSREKAKALARTYKERADQGRTLFEVAAENGLNLKTTGFIGKTDPVEGLRFSYLFTKKALATPVGSVSDIHQSRAGYYLIQPVEEKKPGIGELEDVKGKISSILMRKKQNEKAMSEAGALLDALRSGTSFAEASRPFAKMVHGTGFQSSEKIASNLALDQDARRALCLLNQGTPIPEAILKGNRVYYVVKLKDRVTHYLGHLIEDKPNIRKIDTSEPFVRWMKKLRSESDVNIEKPD